MPAIFTWKYNTINNFKCKLISPLLLEVGNFQSLIDPLSAEMIFAHVAYIAYKDFWIWLVFLKYFLLPATLSQYFRIFDQ